MIESIQDISRLIVSGNTDWQQYGDVNAVYHDDHVLFNYTAQAQYAGRWNWFEQNARGLIFDAKTGELKARPFPKFFNYGEGGRMPAQDTYIRRVTVKMDGSLGILHERNGKLHIATRGSFTSEQAQWATEFLHTHCWQHLPMLETLVHQGFTVLFEIIYPENRIVVDYEGFQGLVLLSVIERETLHEPTLDLIMPTLPEFDRSVKSGMCIVRQPFYRGVDSTTAMEWLKTVADNAGFNFEGFVVTFSDGTRFKIKGEDYLRAHRFMTSVSFNSVLQAVADGTLNEIIEGVPDEFLGTVRAWQEEIELRVKNVTAIVEHKASLAPAFETRKELAMWVQQHEKALQPYLYAQLDGKPIRDLIFKREFKDN